MQGQPNFYRSLLTPLDEPPAQATRSAARQVFGDTPAHSVPPVRPVFPNQQELINKTSQLVQQAPAAESAHLYSAARAHPEAAVHSDRPVEQPPFSAYPPAERALLDQYLRDVEHARRLELASIERLRQQLLTLDLPPTEGGAAARRAQIRSPRVLAIIALLGLAAALALAVVGTGQQSSAGTTSSLHAHGGQTAAPAAKEAAAGHTGHEHTPAGKPQGAAADAAPAGAKRLDVTLGEFFVRADRRTVPAGPVTLRAHNTGKIEHELMIAPKNKLPKRMDTASSELVHERVLTSLHGLTPGKRDEVTLRLKPGTYVLFCNLPGHFAMGQKRILTVR